MALTKGKIIVIIIIILILISIVAIYMMTSDDEVSDIQILSTDTYYDDDESGLEINGIIETKGTINDNGKLKIIYDGSSVFSRSVNINNNKIGTKIPWKDFVVGNEKYTIQLDYGGKTGEDAFLLSKYDLAVCEKIQIATQLTPAQITIDNLNEQPKLNVVLSFVDDNDNNLLASVNNLDISKLIIEDLIVVCFK